MVARIDQPTCWHGPTWPKCAPACHSGLDKLRRDPAWLPSDQHKSDISSPDLVSRTTRLGATLGNWHWRISTGQWGNQGDPSSGSPVLPGLLAPSAPAVWATALGHRKVRWSVRQPSLQRLPTLQHLPGCLFLKSYLNTSPPAVG